MANNLKSNIWKLSFIKTLKWFILIMPVIVLFYQENGLSMKEVFFLQAVFSIIIVLFEVPSGYFADKFGRRLSIIIGCSMSFIGLLAYSFSYGLIGFLIAESIMAIGNSFISGADSALLYDSLLGIKREKEYKKIEGRVLSMANFSEGTASIIGGFLALISLRTPLYLWATVSFFTIPLAFMLIEPGKHKKKSTDISTNSLKKIIRYSLHEHSEIKWLIIYSAIIGASTLTLVWFIQPYLNLVGLPLALFGIVWAALQYFVGIFSIYAHKIENFFGRRASLVSLLILSFSGYVLLSIFQELWSIIFLLIFYFVRGISGPVTNDYTNTLVTSDIRATVLSIKQLAVRLLFSIVGPLMGWVNDIYSLQTAFFFSGLIFLLSGLVCLFFLKKHGAL